MRLMHISDLHLGKRVNEYSMLDDQAYILDEILRIAKEEEVQGVLIAGDVYDRPVPPSGAVRILDDLLDQFADRNVPVFFISGNHDSRERLAFGAALFEKSGVYMAGEELCKKIRWKDEYGELNIWLMPFLKPAEVRMVYSEKEISTYTDAVRAVLEGMEIDPDVRNILVAHQFVAGAVQCESEEISIGGLDQVDVSVLERFDYVALGHLHRPQSVGRETIRYCGTPLKYSFSEASQHKSVTFVELGEKGSVTIAAEPLVPRHDLRELRGSYMELTDRRNYEGTAVDDYLHITLTDEQDIPEALARLRVIYPNLMRLDYDNRRTQTRQELDAPAKAEQKTPLEHFADFYQLQNNQPLTHEQAAFCQQLIESIWKEEDA